MSPAHPGLVRFMQSVSVPLSRHVIGQTPKWLLPRAAHTRLAPGPRFRLAPSMRMRPWLRDERHLVSTERSSHAERAAFSI